MKLIPTIFKDVVLIEPDVFEDERGWFIESFNARDFCQEMKKIGLTVSSPFIQDNHSYSKKGVLRGLHYQLAPYAQGKLVRVVQGSVYDVVVDVRANSPTFGQSIGYELNAKNRRMLWIPKGFAHGFLALEDDTQFLYKITDIYHKESEVCIRWDDPDLAINWPDMTELIINKKDQAGLSLREAVKISYTPISNKAQIIDLAVIGDKRGSLIVLENGSNLPFDIQRAYYIFGTQAEVSRGFHAHKQLQQMAVCVSGSCSFILDNGKTREKICLNSPSKGLLINHMIWREMHEFTDDCVLVVLANERYNEADYIRDYAQFLKEVQANECV